MHLTPKPGKGKSRPVSSAKRQNRGATGCLLTTPDPCPETRRPALHRLQSYQDSPQTDRFREGATASLLPRQDVNSSCPTYVPFQWSTQRAHTKATLHTLACLLCPASPREALTGGDTHALSSKHSGLGGCGNKCTQQPSHGSSFLLWELRNPIQMWT